MPRYGSAVLAKVERLIKRRWSPKQICGTLRTEGSPVPSHETIYRHLHRDRAKHGHLFRFTRIMSKKGRKHYRSPATRGVLPGKRHISERPIEVEGRLESGHWEGDTIMGQDLRHCLLTLVERKSGFVIIHKLRARTKAEVTRAATRAIAQHVNNFKTILSTTAPSSATMHCSSKNFPLPATSPRPTIPGSVVATRTSTG